MQEDRGVVAEASATADAIGDYSDEVLVALLGAHVDGDEPPEIEGTGGRFALVSQLRERGYEIECGDSIVVRDQNGVEINFRDQNL
jgi:hypothetical protein